MKTAGVLHFIAVEFHCWLLFGYLSQFMSATVLPAIMQIWLDSACNQTIVWHNRFSAVSLNKHFFFFLISTFQDTKKKFYCNSMTIRFIFMYSLPPHCCTHWFRSFFNFHHSSFYSNFEMKNNDFTHYLQAFFSVTNKESWCDETMKMKLIYLDKMLVYMMWITFLTTSTNIHFLTLSLLLSFFLL